MHSKKHLSFNSLIHGFRKIVDGFFDVRKQAVDYSLTDAVLSGFACMYFQDPSLLQFQKRLESEGGRSNLSTLFHCLQKEHRSGEITFSHQALQGAIVHPDIRQVIPLMVEDIRNEDGKTKQDCEINAGKRFVEQLRKEHSQFELKILAPDKSGGLKINYSSSRVTNMPLSEHSVKWFIFDSWSQLLEFVLEPKRFTPSFHPP